MCLRVTPVLPCHYYIVIIIIIIIVIIIIIIIFSGYAAQRGLWPTRHTRFLDHTQRRATVGGTPFGRVISSSQKPLST
jgi:hypothetical protein